MILTPEEVEERRERDGGGVRWDSVIPELCDSHEELRAEVERLRELASQHAAFKVDDAKNEPLGRITRISSSDLDYLIRMAELAVRAREFVAVRGESFRSARRWLEDYDD